MCGPDPRERLPSSHAAEPYYLGVSSNLYSSSASLVRGREILAAAEEERFTGAKNDGRSPFHAMRYCLRSAGITGRDLARVIVSWDYNKYAPGGEAPIRAFMRQQERNGLRMDVAAVERYIARYDGGKVQAGIQEAIGESPEPEFLPHHHCHAASAFFCSGFREAVVLVMDGSGEEIATSVYLGRGHVLEQVDQLPVPDSLGHVYQGVTEYLGYRPHQEEGTVMALAALGRLRPELVALMEACVSVGEGGYQVDTEYIAKQVFQRPRERYQGGVFTDRFAEQAARCGVPLHAARGEQAREALQPAADLAAATQEVLGRAIYEVAAHHLGRHRLDHLCLAGGVMLNCKANGQLLARLVRERDLRGFFVQPASSDAGGSLGAALWAAERAAEASSPRPRLRSAALGPSFTPAQVEPVLRASGLPHAPLGGRWDEIARRLHEGAIVALFSGRMEFGPRALGNRSILASPRSKEIVARLNALKGRQWFRPTCPSLLPGPALAIPHQAVYSPDFMIVAYDGPEEIPPHVAGAFHLDGSFRPQLLARDDASELAHLLREVEQVSGHPVVLNTSFNVKGPIVCTPEQAVQTFQQSDIDLMVIQGYVASKKALDWKEGLP